MDTNKSNGSVSVIIPFYNEEDNINPLMGQLLPVLKGLGCQYEIVCIDDGSTDTTLEKLRKISEEEPNLKIISFRCNYGQTAAMSAAFSTATGDIVIALDGDMQNDPTDIPLILKKMSLGYDLVSGWRKNRQDALLTRKIPSMIANKIISWVGGVPLKDYGCTLKGYRSTYVKDMKLFGEMHRFIPIYVKWMGAKIAEIPVNHHPRTHGKSKYGLMRTFKVILDLLTVKFLGAFSTKPIYIFGGAGFLCTFLGIVTSGIVLYQKFVLDIWVHKNPILTMSVVFFLIGCQCVLMGLLAEIVVRIYHESRHHPSYWVKESINLDKD